MQTKLLTSIISYLNFLTSFYFRVHNIEPEVYDIYVDKKKKGETIPNMVNCKVCSRLCYDLEKHLSLSHRLEYSTYLTTDYAPIENGDYLCNFENCDQSFNREGDLLVHLDIKHANDCEEKKNEIKRAILEKSDAAQISAKLLCKLCSAEYSSRSSLWGHVTRTHSLTWQEYEDTYGHVSREISDLAPWTCNIEQCGKKVKNERNVIIRHVKSHGLTWEQYTENYVKNNNFVQQKLEDLNIIKKSHKNKKKKSGKINDTALDSTMKSKKSKKSKSRINEYFEHPVDFDDRESKKDKKHNQMKASPPSPVIKEEIPEDSDDDEMDVQSQFVNCDIKPRSPPGPPIQQQESSPLVYLPGIKPIKSLPGIKPIKSMNVADKGLKTCNKCNMDFPSRLRFIKHCQLAHKMKFKLKNGDKLLLP